MAYLAFRYENFLKLPERIADALQLKEAYFMDKDDACVQMLF